MKNTKIFKSIFTLFLTLSFVVALFGCVETVSYSVTFESEGTTLAVVKVENGKTVPTDQLPANPTKEGYAFVGWFDGETEFDQKAAVTADVSYTAKFEAIPVYSVSFYVDEEEVAKFNVLEGNLVEGELPTNPTKEGYNFVGWFDGEKEFDQKAAVTADATYTAKFSEKTYYTLSFVVEGNEVAKVKVEEGKTIDFALVPMDPTKKAYEFMGWFNGDEKFNELAKVESDATYVAKYERVYYVATFGETEVLVPVDGTLSMKEVANPSQEGAYFAGWYAGSVKATEGLQLENDTEFAPKFVTIESFNGTWASSNGLWFTIENGKVVCGKFGEKGMTFNFDATTGTLSYKESSYVFNQHAFEVSDTGIKYVHSYWDDIYEEMANDVVELSTPTGGELTGTYTSEKSTYITIIDGGIVTRYNGALTTTGMVVETEEGYAIKYSASSSSEKTVTFTFDEKGNMVAEGKIYVKNTENFAYLYCSGQPTFFFYTVNGEQVVTVKDGSTYYYGALTGTLALNEIISISYNEKEVTLKVTGETSYVFAGEEKGTYTQGENTLVLDGFGNATLNGTKAEYELNGAGVVLLGENGYKLNSAANSYETLVKDAVNNGKYIENGNVRYYISFDGFGGVTQTYEGSYSTSVTTGSYTLTQNGVKIANVSYSYNGEWTFELDGKALLKGEKVYLLEGAVFEDVKEELNGSYGENGEYVVTTGKVVVNGVEYTLKYNFNGSKASYEVKHKDANSYGVLVEFTDTITLSKTADGKLKVVTENVTWDEYDEGAMSTFSEAEYPVYSGSVEPTYDAFKGTWSGKTSFGSTLVYVINGDGTGTLDGNAITYTISGNKLAFVYNYEDYSLTGDPATGKLTAVFTYDYEDMPAFEVTKQEEKPATDGYEGTWSGKNSYGNAMVYVINGDGTGTLNGNAITYTISGNKLAFVYNYEDYSLTGDPATGKLTAVFTYDYEDMPAFEVTKQGEAQPATDGYEGTWKQQGGNGNVFVFDGQGKGTFNGNNFTYTVSGEEVTFTVGGMYFKVSGKSSSGKLRLTWEDDDYNDGVYDIVKQ